MKTLPELLELAATASLAELGNLEHLAGAIAAEDAGFARQLADELAAVHTDTGSWLRAMLLEAAGDHAQAAGALHLLREKAAGEERASILLASARNLLAAGQVDQVWHPLAAAAKSSAVPRTLRNVARLLATARKKAEPPVRRRCRVGLLSTTTVDLLAPILRAQCFGAGIDAEIYVGPFGQIDQEI